MMSKISKLTATLKDDKKWAGEVGDLLVYLKYYATCSFQAENEIMLRHGFSAYYAHREQHENITEELRRLLEQIVADNASMPLITDASNRLLSMLQKHIAKHDCELMVLMDKDKRLSEAVHHNEVRHREYSTVLNLNCYTS
jgi:hemerythrin-like metal-binding protein